MHNLNLYNYYDKSLADINREYLESLKYKPKKVSKKHFDRRHILALAITVLTGLGIANHLGVFDEPVVETVQAPPPVDTRTEEEKQGYVQIQIFEFADTPVETVTEKIKTDNETIKSIDNNSIAMNNTNSAVDKVNIAKTETKENQKNLCCLLTKMQKLGTTFLLQILLCVYGTEHRKQGVISKNAVEDPGQHFRDDK